MLGVGVVCVFNTEDVNSRGKVYLVADVSKEPRIVFAWHVPIGLEVVFELVVGDATGLLQAVHAFPNLH